MTRECMKCSDEPLALLQASQLCIQSLRISFFNRYKRDGRGGVQRDELFYIDLIKALFSDCSLHVIPLLVKQEREGRREKQGERQINRQRETERERMKWGCSGRKKWVTVLQEEATQVSAQYGKFIFSLNLVKG